MADRMPDVAEADVIVDRRPDYRGWQIRTRDQLPGQGTIVTDHWLATFGFGQPSKFNIERIIDAMAANLAGYAPVPVDLDHQAQKWGDPFSEKGSAPDIEFGEGLGNVH